jgi:DNA transformation protein
VSEFTDYLHQVFELFGQITTRRMFGGVVVFHEGLMFAPVADETLYLKTDGRSSC